MRLSWPPYVATVLCQLTQDRFVLRSDPLEDARNSASIDLPSLHASY